MGWTTTVCVGWTTTVVTTVVGLGAVVPVGGIFVGVLVGVLVGVFVGVFVGVLVGVFVGVFVGVGDPVGVGDASVQACVATAGTPGPQLFTAVTSHLYVTFLSIPNSTLVTPN